MNEANPDEAVFVEYMEGHCLSDLPKSRHLYLLATSFELDETLRARGHVTKPIVGRCGGNIRVVGEDERVIEETPGQLADRDLIHQVFPLARVGGHYVQPSTFTVGRVYATSAARVDESLVITRESNSVALRFVDDEHFLALLQRS